MDSKIRVINAVHELSAPKLFKRRKEETEEHMQKTLLVGALPSNSTSRTTRIERLRDFSRAKNCHKEETIENFNIKPEKERVTGLICKRVRPPKIRNYKELKGQEKAPQFKAIPLNKKILESKGELGLLCNKKRQVTIPKEFHFALNERIPQRITTNGAQLYDKITLCLKSQNKKLIPRNTTPRPFHLHTEKRGAQKEIKFGVRIVQKQKDGGGGRIPITRTNTDICT